MGAGGANMLTVEPEIKQLQPVLMTQCRISCCRLSQEGTGPCGLHDQENFEAKTLASNNRVV